jgi:hypothetical protein
MKSISLFLNTPEITKEVVKNIPRSEKANIIEQLYEIYSNKSQKQKREIKKVKEIPLKKFAIFLSKHSKDVLYEILSISKDKDSRGEDAGGYIAGNFWRFY